MDENEKESDCMSVNTVTDESKEWWNAGWRDGYDAGLKVGTKIRYAGSDKDIDTDVYTDNSKNRCGCGD